MTKRDDRLRDDALAIWQAGVDAVRSDRLVLEHVRIELGQLLVADESFSLSDIRRILVVGTGKAGAGMAAGLEEALGQQLMDEKQLSGWINVPEDCVRQLQRINLHGARPAGVNEPTQAGVDGASQILKMVSGASPDDLCICLVSGGGSALLPAPIDGVTLADKQAITKHLSGAGANIQQLNTVRKQLSRIKGGGLARTCRAGRMITLIISDVIGDPLDIIASGPTVEDSSTPQDALDVLKQFGTQEAGIASNVFSVLGHAAGQFEHQQQTTCQVSNYVIGNNAAAVDAAGVEAERRGYSHAMHAAVELEGEAEGVGRHLASMALRMRRESGPDCLITGGEPVVRLVAESERGVGGRNQQLVLAALEQLIEQSDDANESLNGIALLAGGTDGEDGPTDAAGAIIDCETVSAMQRLNLTPSDFLKRNDAYHFFDAVGGLVKTGPTHTNVCDLRVVVIANDE